MKVKGVFKNGVNWGARIWKDGKTINLGTYETEDAAKAMVLQKRDDFSIEGNHDMSNTPIYSCWRNMKARCSRKNHPQYHNYGERGVKVCGEWLEFRNFYKDMGDCPNRLLSIDRIDNNGNYELGNCRWATKRVQAINQRIRKDNTSGLKGVSWNKKESMWLAFIGVDNETARLYYGKDFFEACCARKSAELKYY